MLLVKYSNRKEGRDDPMADDVEVVKAEEYADQLSHFSCQLH